MLFQKVKDENKDDGKLKIEEITLLSEEEYKKYKGNVKRFDDPIAWWWLRTPANLDNVKIVRSDGSVGYTESGSHYDLDYYKKGNIHQGVIRPALRISNLKSLDLKPGDEFRLKGHTWTIISNDLALMDDNLGKCFFCADQKRFILNDYEHSTVKQIIEDWAKRNRLIDNIREPKIIKGRNVDKLKIKDVTLLSLEEYKKYRTNIRGINEAWWLQTPYSEREVQYIDDPYRIIQAPLHAYPNAYAGGLDSAELLYKHDYAIRPVLRISNLETLDLMPGDKIKLKGHTWTVIGDDLALADDIFGHSKFIDNWDFGVPVDYEKSDVRKFLKNWAKEQGLINDTKDIDPFEKDKEEDPIDRLASVKNNDKDIGE